MFLKYVDDNLQFKKINMENGVRTPGIRTKHATLTEDSFRWITRRATRRGMKVNTQKTAILCMSGATSYKAAAFLEDVDGNRVASGNTMKVLGFHLSS